MQQVLSALQQIGHDWIVALPHTIIILIIGIIWGLVGGMVYGNLKKPYISQTQKKFSFIIFNIVVLFLGIALGLTNSHGFIATDVGSKVIQTDTKALSLYQDNLNICMFQGMQGLLDQNYASASAAVKKINTNMKTLNNLHTIRMSQIKELESL